MTKLEAIKILGLIETVYSCKIKSDTVLKWFNQCHSMDYEVIMRRVLDHISKRRYPPTMSEITQSQKRAYHCKVTENRNKVSSVKESFIWMEEYMF